jgi:hypothetical protein
MELIIIAFLTATGKVWVLSKLMTLKRLVRWSKWFDLFFIFILPIMFFGTFQGMIVAVLSGLWFTAIVWFLSLFIKNDNLPSPPR